MFYLKLKRYFSLDFMRYIFGRFLLIRKLKKKFRRYYKYKKTILNSEFNYVKIKSSKNEIIKNLEDYGISNEIHLEKKINDFILENYKKSEFSCHQRYGKTNNFKNYEDLKNNFEKNKEIPPYFELKNQAFNKLFQEISRSSEILEIVRNYIGDIKKIDIKLNYSTVSNLDNNLREIYHQTVNWHFDVHDINFVYVFFYINGSDKNSGAHEVIKGSHKKKKFFKHLIGSAKQQDSKLRKFYNENDFFIIEGKEGDGFIEDTSCYHRALPPKSNSRLCLQLRYH